MRALKKLQRMNRNTIEEKVGSVVTIESFLDIFDDFLVVKKIEGCANTTVQGYRDNMDKCFCKFLKVEQIDKTTILDIGIIRNYIGYLQDKGLKGSTINIRLRTLRAYIKWLTREEVIDESISRKFKLVKQEEKKIVTLSELQIERLFSVIDTEKYNGFRDYVAFSMMLETGIRCKELVNLKADDIRLEQRMVIVRATTAKTRRERHLPITKGLKRHLKELIEIANTTDYDWVFQRHNGGQSTTATIRKALHDYKVKARIKTTVSPHILRHTFASIFILRGGDQFTLSSILGHTTLQMSRRYVNLNSEQLRKVYDKFYK